MNEESWFDSPQGQDSNFSCNPTRPSGGPTQSRISWILGALSLMAERPTREAHHRLIPSSTEVKNDWS